MEEEHQDLVQVRLAERLGHTPASVSEMVKRLVGMDHLTVTGRTLALTESGRAIAQRVVRKHRLAERLLTDIIGMDWHVVHEEACRWEHVMSEAVERKIALLLTDVTHSPFGMPVPGLELLGLTAANPRSCKPISSVGSGEYELIRIGEPVQVDQEFLLQLAELGLVPGAKVVVTVEKTGWLLSATAKTEGLLLDELIASHLFVG
jgi:DtxR family Mn-dependent transcriptional regulator